ncbi:MAG: radical SAM protein, partial [Candidatus Pacearchaeota archaeon]
KVKEDLKKKGYGLVGETSAVQICHWTKEAIRGRGGCWKEKFYGIQSSRCCQFSPAVMWCENKCLHCWRPIELNLGLKLHKVDSPEKILEGIIKERKRLLIGFFGRKGINKEKLKEALEPSLFTLSLSGEATLYPKLPDLIKLIRQKKAISFLVTNGQNPSMLKKLIKEDALPTQLSLSMNAPNKTLFEKWHNSLRKDAWKRFNESLDIIRTLKNKCRRCIRLTLVSEGSNKKESLKSITNMKDVEGYSLLIKKADPDFIHVKGYTAIGYSRERLGYDKQPFFKEIKKFALELIKNLNKNSKDKWKILGEMERSNIVLVGRSKKNMLIKPPY